MELFEDWVVEMVFNPNKPTARAGWDKYEAATKKRIESDITIRGYDTVKVLAESIRLGGNPDSSETIRDGFYKIKDFPLLSGQKTPSVPTQLEETMRLRQRTMSLVL